MDTTSFPLGPDGPKRAAPFRDPAEHQTAGLPEVLDSQTSAEKSPSRKDFASWCCGGEVTPEFATSCLDPPLPAGPFVSIRRVVDVRLDRRGGAAETVGDLPDREALELAVMARKRDRAATFDHAAILSRRRTG
jgi:hypothetical protein